MCAESLFAARALSVKLADKLVLNKLSLDFFAGEMLALIGPNGAGKSSLLHTLAGEIAPVHGEIFLQGKSLDAWSLQERARKIAVLPQYNTLNFPYRVQEVVALARLPHATGLTRDRRIVQAALDAMDMSALENQLYTQLSGGEKQRCQLARVLAQVWPEKSSSQALLLLDEPCAGLDPGHVELLITQLKQFCHQGITVVLVLHDINFASQHTDRILVMDKGRLIAQGCNTDVITPELLNKVFKAHGHVFRHPELGHPVYL